MFSRTPRPCQGHVVLAVPGFAHTAATWGPFADSILDEKLAGEKVCQLVALDLPGHGDSSLPTGGLAFGDMTLADSVAVVLASLERLPGRGIRPDTLLGHSQGGLVIQMVQQALKDAGSNLRQQFHVGTAGLLLQAFVSFDPLLGVHIRIPDAVWPAVFFSNLSGSVAPDAPTAAEVAAHGFNAPEPLVAALELVGAPPFARPLVDAGIFGPDTHTTLVVASFEQNTIIRPDETALLYEHLTGDSTRAGVVEIVGAAAVHDLYISDPDHLREELADRIKLR